MPEFIRYLPAANERRNSVPLRESATRTWFVYEGIGSVSYLQANTHFQRRANQICVEHWSCWPRVADGNALRKTDYNEYLYRN